jgi:hypothetical protein
LSSQAFVTPPALVMRHGGSCSWVTLMVEIEVRRFLGDTPTPSQRAAEAGRT